MQSSPSSDHIIFSTFGKNLPNINARLMKLNNTFDTSGRQGRSGSLSYERDSHHSRSPPRVGVQKSLLTAQLRSDKFTPLADRSNLPQTTLSNSKKSYFHLIYLNQLP